MRPVPDRQLGLQYDGPEFQSSDPSTVQRLACSGRLNFSVPAYRS